MVGNLLNHVVAMGADTGAGAVTGNFDTALSGVSSALTFSGTILDFIIGNPIYLFFFAVPLAGVGIALFRMIKRAASRS